MRTNLRLGRVGFRSAKWHILFPVSSVRFVNLDLARVEEECPEIGSVSAIKQDRCTLQNSFLPREWIRLIRNYVIVHT